MFYLPAPSVEDEETRGVPRLGWRLGDEFGGEFIVEFRGEHYRRRRERRRKRRVRKALKRMQVVRGKKKVKLSLWMKMSPGRGFHFQFPEAMSINISPRKRREPPIRINDLPRKERGFIS